MQHNKKREELQRLQEKYPEQTAKLNRQAARQAGGAAKRVGAAGGGAGEEGGSDEDSSSEDEDEDAERIISEKTQAQVRCRHRLPGARDACTRHLVAQRSARWSCSTVPADRGSTTGQPAARSCWICLPTGLSNWPPSATTSPACAPPCVVQIFETLLKIRRRDQSIYQPDAKFYSSGESEGEDEGGRMGKQLGQREHRGLEAGAVGEGQRRPVGGACRRAFLSCSTDAPSLSHPLALQMAKGPRRGR